MAFARRQTKPSALAVAKNLFKLMAYKDEYEVARLYTDGGFARELSKQFKGDFKLKFHLAPPILGRRDEVTGHAVKSSFGPWMMTAMALLAKMKGLRGTAFDVFGRSEERRMERKLIADYRLMISDIASRIAPANYKSAMMLANLPEQIRGFGHVKTASVVAAEIRRDELLSAMSAAAILSNAAE